MNTQSIQLDVSKIPSNTPIIRIGQKDKDGTTLIVHVLDHGEPLDLSDFDATLYIKFSDETMYEFAGTVDGSAAEFVIDGTDMVSGTTNNACVSLSSDDVVLSTARFPVEVLISAERS